MSTIIRTTDMIERLGLTRRSVIVGGVVLGSGLASGCQALGLEWRYRYRLTAEVERQGKLYSASSVIEVIRSSGYDSIHERARGEAVALDLPGVGTLFFLLYGVTLGINWPATMPHHAFENRLGSASETDRTALDRLVQMQGANAELAPDLYPMIVRFKNIRDLKSVEEVTPTDLTTRFGPNTRLRRLMVTVTNDGVTRSILEHLPSLGATDHASLDGSISQGSCNTLANKITTLYFERI